MVMPYRDGASLRRGSLMAVLAHGRPLVTTRPQVGQGLPGTPELRHEENVWLVEAGDALNLAEAIRRLEEDESARIALAAGAKQLGGMFTWERIAGETVGFLGELVGAGAG
jgi:glycosyltransferase involved in cell wall biosynthesis